MKNVLKFSAALFGLFMANWAQAQLLGVGVKGSVSSTVNAAKTVSDVKTSVKEVAKTGVGTVKKVSDKAKEITENTYSTTQSGIEEATANTEGRISGQSSANGLVNGSVRSGSNIETGTKNNSDGQNNVQFDSGVSHSKEAGVSVSDTSVKEGAADIFSKAGEKVGEAKQVGGKKIKKILDKGKSIVPSIKGDIQVSGSAGTGR